MVSFGRLALLSFQTTLTRTQARSIKLSSSSSSNSLGPILPLSILIAASSPNLFCRTSFISSTCCYCASAFSNSGGSSNSNNMDTFTSCDNEIDIGYLNAKDAYELDQQLFNSGYTLEQLMELAGLAVAHAVFDCVSLTVQHNADSSNSMQHKTRNILVVCGPGNNGGDGLVAARHLALMGYDVAVFYPKRSNREKHYAKLVSQCLDVGVSFIDSMPGIEEHHYDAVVDAIFGFSFKGEPREPFSTAITEMIRMQKENQSQIISVDVPSGWNVDEGDTLNLGFDPDVLVSLTAPKLCAKSFQGRHFVGGRFLPPSLAKAYNIQMPPYPGIAQVMQVSKGTNPRVSLATKGWEAEYAAYCVEKEKELAAKEAEQASRQKGAEILNTDDDDAEDWAVQYHNYCIEKEAKLAREEQAKSSNTDGDKGY